MIRHIPTSTIADEAPSLLASLHQFWDTTINFETVENLYRRLMEDKVQLWLWTGSEGKLLFVTEVITTATARLLQVTHTARFKNDNTPWDLKTLATVIDTVFSEVEDLAKDLNFDALAILARPAHARLAKGYEVQHTKLIKRL